MGFNFVGSNFANFLFAAVLSCNFVSAVTLGDEPTERIDFNRDIRPILSDNCFKCHGPDEHERHADLRLDSRQGLEDAKDSLAPNDVDASELYRRLVTDDDSEIMPPLDSGRSLDARQKELIRLWIAQGAKWQDHWALVKPQKSALPKSNYAQWCSSPIDHFIASTMQQAELSPNIEADRRTLIRRLALDVTGLSPSQELVDKYSIVQSVDWYEQLVDELLDSNHYGEHMARHWLDAARYGDTHGLHLDNYREMWLYRDWVVNAFNRNLSYRDFLIEQLAGDLLKNPTESQLIATGFNRAHVTTNEGGSILDEIVVRNVVDRVATTSTVFMGLTVGCAQCHDHKYDPISQKEFYQLFAFFNSLDANAMDGNAKIHAPFHRQFTEDQKVRIESMQSRGKEIDQQINSIVADFKYEDPLSKDSNDLTQLLDSPRDFVWFDDDLPPGTKLTGKWSKKSSEEIGGGSGESVFTATNKDFTQNYFLEAEPRLYVTGQDKFFAMVYLDPDNPPREIMLQFNDGDWNHRAYWGKDLINFGKTGTTQRMRLGDLPETGKWVRLEVTAKEVGFKNTHSIQGIAFSQFGGTVHWDTAGVETILPQTFNKESLNDWIAFRRTVGADDLPKAIRDTLQSKELDEKAIAGLQRHYIRHINPRSKNLLSQPLAEKEQLKVKLKSITDSAPTTLVWKEKQKPVEAYVLKRGEYDQKGDLVTRDTPAALPDFAAYRKDRLGLAHWLVDEDHPLTARVAVNRIWSQIFGLGIVETVEDFGAQGQLPSHPELLDWLAIDFVENGWDVKRLVKQILMSATYRQSSQCSENAVALDQGNRLLSRGPRGRLDAEVLRDQALAVSGLLVNKLGGPSVKPPQPDGLWYAVGYTRSNTVRFKPDTGSDKVHRRSLYTFWKRTSPPPQMSTFDAPTRESCVLRRERTNTPMQALLLMNDPQYVEAARHLAQLTVASADGRKQRIRFMFKRALLREPTFEEFEILESSVKQSLNEFESNKDSAKELLAIGESKAGDEFDASQLAAYTMLANLIMNMDEFVSRN